MAGGKSAEWVDEEFPFVFTDKASEFIKKNKSNPFFLYYSFTDIHVPRAPNKRFRGKSDMGRRGDAIVQMDWAIGKINKLLEEEGMTENTILIITSDNGPVIDDGYNDKAVEMVGDHKPSGPFRGGKYSIYEGGTRVPMIVYWPGKTNSSESPAMMNQLDIYASLAELVGADIGENVIDSKSHLDALLGKSAEGRDVMLEEAFTLALRDGNWKYIQPFTNGSIPDWMDNKDIEPGLKPEPQLYDLSKDKGEQNNLAEEQPEKVKEYEKMIQDINGKSLD